MSNHRSSLKHRPLECLGRLVEQKKLVLENTPPTAFNCQGSCSQDPDSDNLLFEKAMAGVTRIKGSKRIEKRLYRRQSPSRSDSSDIEVMQQLRALVETGEGFRVSLTPEYIEGAGTPIHPAILKRLHRGDFSIQDYVDLHGMCLKEAENRFNSFLKKSIATGKSAVLVVHGRGLSSPGKPILKSNVVKWMNSGTWRKWIAAYASARLCDGGAGATYILLRKQQRTRR